MTFLFLVCDVKRTINKKFSCDKLALSSLLQVQYPLVNMTSTILCDQTGVTPEMVKGKALVVMSGGCELSLKALIAQSLGATTLLVANNKSLVGH